MNASSLPPIRLEELASRLDAQLAPGGIRAVIVAAVDIGSTARRIARPRGAKQVEAPPDADALVRRLRAAGDAVVIVSGLEAFSEEAWGQLDLLKSRLLRDAPTVLVLSPRSMTMLVRTAPHLATFVSPLWSMPGASDEEVAEGATERPSAQVDDANAGQRERMIRLQYREASKLPGEFVVMVGPRVLFHSTDRDEAILRYESGFEEVSEGMPVFIEPGTQAPDRDPVARGRSKRGV
ncbi:MAG: hypothetical protein ABI193_18440 [Minicystis sp.]